MGGGAGDAGREDRVSPGRRVVVVGGGLAGITAALDCAAAGASVTLVEVRRRLGGAAYSFQRDGLEMDNGQHVFLRCCVAYRALLRRLGSEHLVHVQPRLDIPVLKPGAPPARLRRGSLPAPLHLAGALARYPHLSPAQRLGAARAAFALMRLGQVSEGRAQELERLTFGEWLARHGQGPEAVSALWDLIALPTLNLPAAQASLALGAFVFRTGLLSGADAGDIGFHTATLSETIGTPAEEALRRAGVEVRLGWRAERLQSTAAGLEVLGRGQRAPGGERPAAQEDRAGGAPAGGDVDELAADAAIVALPHTRAASLLEPLLPDVSAKLRRLGSSPIVNLHVLYDRTVYEEPFAAGVGTPVQYIFDRSAAAGAPAGCQYLAVSLSGAEREMGMSVEALRELFEPALRELLPRARQASVVHFVATREHAATFRAAPGVAALRPGPQTAVPGLLLAGAWTDTGWPATLEGAVLSGHAAARAALQSLELDPGEGEEPPAHRATDSAASAAGALSWM
jgi:hydroxysqualene dehydroxylase